MTLPEWLVVAGAAETGGAFELIQETRAVVGGPAPHVHREHGEGFLVLEGRYRFVRGDEETEVGEGASCSFRAASATPSARSPRRRES